VLLAHDPGQRAAERARLAAARDRVYGDPRPIAALQALLLESAS
jgi:hypothetical protein